MSVFRSKKKKKLNELKRIKRRNIKKKIFLSVFAIAVSVFIITTIFIYYGKSHLESRADAEIYRKAKRENTTRFYYNDGNNFKELIGSEIYSSQKYLYAPFNDIPEDMINAFIAIEDKRFYSHSGVDWYRTASAAANYILKFKDSYGASTITQQLVKNITGNDDFKVERKIQEIIYALSLESQMDKSEIIEVYLNVINLSHGCKGVRAAAKTYFSKDLQDLDLLECVCIAAITNSPSYYDPFYNPENNKRRRQIILDEMLAQNFISDHDYTELYSKDINLNMNSDYKSEKVNSWYIDMVIDDVINDLIQNNNYTKEKASNLVYGGGLKIYTSINPEIQSIMEKYYADNTEFPYEASGVKAQTSMIVIDPFTGDILGVVGGRGEKQANRIQNFATQTLRPSGSVIKPLSVYAPAIDKRIISYASVFDDVPVNFGKYNLDSKKGEIIAPKPWPNNAPTIYHGLVNVNYAIEVSLNTVPVKILEKLGREVSFDFLKNKLCIENLIDKKILSDGTIITDKDYASLALGQMNYGVTVREITAGYTIFDNKGNYCKPRSYSLVQDSNGNTLLKNDINIKKAIGEDSAAVMNQMLKNVIKSGTAEGIDLGIDIDVAGKTGTSQNYDDRWFIGYTPELIGGVWYGYEYPKPLDKNTKHICTKIWNDIFKEIYANKSEYKKNFDDSDNVIKMEYCMDSGKLMTDACKLDPRGHRCEEGYFIKGTEPKSICDRHTMVLYDRIYGGVSEGFCPGFNTKLVGLINVERHFPMQIYVKDAQYVWRELPADIMPSDDVNKPFFANMIEKGDYCGISYNEVQFNRACKIHFNYLAWLLRRNSDLNN